MNPVAYEDAELPIFPLPDCESDIFPLSQLVFRILCFSTGYLLINAWNKRIKAQSGWRDESTKNGNANESGLSQTFFKAQILKWLPSSPGRHHATCKDAQQGAPGMLHRLKVSGTDTQSNQKEDVTASSVPVDCGMQSDLKCWLSTDHGVASGRRSVSSCRSE
eukprot:gnl/MRDRNA2_/MRDRNA2_85907_c1_seq1.p1 gnl/MRDRNA2_/MRDRNA2_85907_c1~~gnl/MRDRNA2_/MRDRNA2_85907_c1_seq1.p1  ORF type:complete len:163 (-),score=29.65 gnl/MRDRNA2_/MRDRNA2_85907_c1_seq1:369-857(-)